MSAYSTTYQCSSYAAAKAAGKPRSFAWRISIGRDLRFWAVLGLLGIGLAAVAVYVITANLILLEGESIKRDQAALRALEREYSALESIVAQRQSPSWLEEQSQVHGLVEISGVRYLIGEPAVALSHSAP